MLARNILSSVGQKNIPTQQTQLINRSMLPVIEVLKAIQPLSNAQMDFEICFWMRLLHYANRLSPIFLGENVLYLQVQIEWHKQRSG